MLFGQSFTTSDLPVIALLVVLEGVLSIDNALVLGLLAKRLPKEQQKRALSYGLIGAFVFRFLAIATATFLLKWTVFKLLGGAYLLYVAVHYFLVHARGSHDKPDLRTHAEDLLNPSSVDPEAVAKIAASTDITKKGINPVHAGFWSTVVVIEMTDVAFAVDSIVAAIGVVGPPPRDLAAGALHPKLWVVILGGFIGVILMRFAAMLFIRILERFPRFQTAAYLLVLIIGLKLVIDWGGNYFFATPERPHPVDFHSFKNPATWIFWISMVVCFAIGFVPARKPLQSDARS